MGKQADFQPRWLVSLLSQWARRIASEENGALGYPKQAAFLTIGRATSARTDPTEFSAADYAELEAALEECRVDHLALWAATMMYYKPWVVESFKAEGWPFAPNQVYFDNLHKAHAWISTKILSISKRMVA